MTPMPDSQDHHDGNRFVFDPANVLSRSYVRVVTDGAQERLSGIGQKRVIVLGKHQAGLNQGGDLLTHAFEFVRDALTHREAFLCISRKNAKSAIVAAYLLARLVGPLRTPGYRAGVCSVNREKAGELKDFQNWVLTKRLRPVASLVMASPIRESSIYRDKLGNPALHKYRACGRIDALSAGVIAVGLADRHQVKRRPDMGGVMSLDVVKVLYR